MFIETIGSDSSSSIVTSYHNLAERIAVKKLKGIIIVSAHWETDQISITSSEFPGLLYDYYGFPPETYEIKYPAPGHQKLSLKIAEKLKEHGFETKLNSSRKFDHGVFIPLKLLVRY